MIYCTYEAILFIKIMDELTKLLFIIALFNAVLGVIIWVHGPRAKKTSSYILLISALVLWSATLIGLRLARSFEASFYSLAISYVSGVAIVICFWYFVELFIKRSVQTWRALVVVIGGVLISISSFFSENFIRDITNLGSPDKVLSVGWAHFVFAAYFVLVMADAFVGLIKSYFSTRDSEIKAQILLIFLGTFITTIIGSFFNIFLVQFSNSELVSYGPVATIIMVGFISYAIIRHNLMNIRVIGAEIFTLALVFMLFFRLVFSRGSDLIFDAVVFAVSLVFGVLLVRAVINEAKNAEHIKELAGALQLSNEKLLQLDRVKSEFISIASHQLRTPLSIIKGYISMTLEGSFGRVNKNLRGILERVYMSNENLVKLVADLLDLSAIEAGRIRYSIEKMDLRDIIDIVVEEMRGLVEKKNLKIIWERPTGNFFANFDKSKFKDALSNLIDNAIKYTEKGSITLSIQKEKEHNNSILISVKDTGLGIESKEVHNLFEKFSRGKIGFKTNTQGIGFGLYVAKRIINDHKGEIWLRSEGRNKGTTFYIRMPAAG